MTVYQKIEAQQNGHENTDIWMVGQQLKDILHGDPALEEIVDKDLNVQEMSLTNAAKKIKAYADDLHRKTKGSCVCVPPDVAEGIIREFYGLPGRSVSDPDVLTVVEDDALPDFADFL